MKHAFLIMAHNEFCLLKRLILALDDERCDIFIHADIKMKEFKQEEIEKLCNKSKIFFCDRFNITWGGI